MPLSSARVFSSAPRHTLRRLVMATVSAALLSTSALISAGAAHAATMETKAREAYLVDFETGTVLLDKNGTTQMPPSSMSKLMTTLMVFERLKEGSLSFDDKFRVSENAWRKGGAASGGSTMFLDINTEVRVEDLLRGVIIQSGNDACIVLAEGLMGTEDTFAEAMTRRAREIGMNDSNFVNATGLPDTSHYMTPKDLATLARYLITHFPEYYRFYSEKEFFYNKIKQHNRNPLLYTMPGADGLKTGHTSVAGYGLTASAQRGERRQIMVINGLSSMAERSEEAQKIMDWGFANFENKTLFTAGETIATAEVWLGDLDEVPLTIQKDLRLTLPRRAAKNLDVRVVYTGPIPAPIQKGQQVAVLSVGGQDMETRIEVPLYAASDVERLGFMGRLMAAARHMIVGPATENMNELTTKALSVPDAGAPQTQPAQ